MNKYMKIENISVEKVKIGDEFFEFKYNDIIKSKEMEIKLFGVRRPFTATKVGKDYVIYKSLNTFIAAKNAGLKEVPCKIIGNKLMNDIIKELNFHRRNYKLKKI